MKMDYLRYQQNFDAVTKQVGVAMHAHGSMTQLYASLMITPNERGGISRLMQKLGRRYVAYVNDHYKRSGTLWEGWHYETKANYFSFHTL